MSLVAEVAVKRSFGYEIMNEDHAFIGASPAVGDRGRQLAAEEERLQ